MFPFPGSFVLATNICPETGSRASEIFGKNLPRLQALKKQYDPNNVFKKWHNLLPE